MDLVNENADDDVAGVLVAIWDCMNKDVSPALRWDGWFKEWEAEEEEEEEQLEEEDRDEDIDRREDTDAEWDNFSLSLCTLIPFFRGVDLLLLPPLRRDDQFVMDERDAERGIEKLDRAFFLVDSSTRLVLFFFLSSCLWNLLLILSASELLEGDGFMLDTISAGATLFVVFWWWW